MAEFSTNPPFPQALDRTPFFPSYSNATPVQPEPRTSVLTTPICCVECGREWQDAGERWRIKVLFEEEPAETVPYCPACHLREFGD